MLNISRFLQTTQELDEFLNAFDQLAPDHVSGGRFREDNIRTLRSNLLFVKLTKEPSTVAEWVAQTREHYAEIEKMVFADRDQEHRLGSHEYGLTRAA
jgi:hypothetical protein